MNPYESPTHCEEQATLVHSPWWAEVIFAVMLYILLLVIFLTYGPIAIAMTARHQTPPSLWQQVEFCLLGLAWQAIVVLAVLGLAWQIV